MGSLSKWAIFDSSYYDPDDELADDNGMVMVFDPHTGQLDMMESNARFKVASCGRRFGKSNLGGHEFIPCAIQAKALATTLKARGHRMEYWIVGPEYADSEKEFRVFYDKASKLGMEFDRPGTYYSVATGDMNVSLWDGAFILTAKSEGRPTSLVGEALSGVIMAEAAKMKEDTWTQLIRPTLSDFGGWALFTTTPEGKNWFYRLYLDSIKENNPEWDGWRKPSWINPHVYTETGRNNAKYRRNDPIPAHEFTIDKDVKRMMYLMNEHPEYTSFEIAKDQNLQIDSEVLQLANDLTIPKFQQEIAADFTDFVGKVFKEYNEETHVRKLPYFSGWETIGAVDYGYRNPNVWLLVQIGPWGEINVIDELYQSDLTPAEFANEIIRRGLCPDTCKAFYPDPASPGDSATMQNIFLRNGLNCTARPHTGGEISDRLNLIRYALKDRTNDTEINANNWRTHPPVPDKRRPRLMVSTRCPKTIYEMGEYRYPEQKDEKVETSVKRFETPVKKDDHTIEALGRFFAGRFHSVQEQLGSGAKISTAQFFHSLGGLSSHPGGYGPEPAGIGRKHTGKIRAPWGAPR